MLRAACIISVSYLLVSSSASKSKIWPTIAIDEEAASAKEDGAHTAKSPYNKVQTISFQIYTGGAPAFTTDSSGNVRRNHECEGCKFDAFMLCNEYIIYCSTLTESI